MWLVIFFTLLFVFVLVAAVETNPDLSWWCLIGRHEYRYVGMCSGMHCKPDDSGIEGTMRRLYRCRCGALKPREKEDYV